jgi:DNA-binding HxlR family transcriptional regulator
MKQTQPKPCPVEVTLGVLGGKWKPMILFYLLQGTCRFSELRRLLPDVTQQMLTTHLRELEAHGVVHRQVYAQVPPKVEYSLTELGRSLAPLLDLMAQWGEKYTKATKATASDRAS